MSGANDKKVGWKQKIIHEIIQYSINFIYLFFFFGMFTLYRRITLSEYQISYLHYGIALVEALVLAKVIMLGDVLHIGQRFYEKPLIWITLYKTVVFSLWTALFGLFEHVLDGLVHGEGLTGGINRLLSSGDELLARALMVFFAFIPFFAFKELGRLLGENKIFDLYFRRGSMAESDSS